MTTHHRTHPPTPRRSRAAIAAALALLPILAASGCTKTLYRQSDIRSQFERYDRARNNAAPMFITDEFGVNTPNLRGRLGNNTAP